MSETLHHIRVGTAWLKALRVSLFLGRFKTGIDTTPHSLRGIPCGEALAVRDLLRTRLPGVTIELVRDWSTTRESGREMPAQYWSDIDTILRDHGAVEHPDFRMDVGTPAVSDFLATGIISWCDFPLPEGMEKPHRLKSVTFLARPRRRLHVRELIYGPCGNTVVRFKSAIEAQGSGVRVEVMEDKCLRVTNLFAPPQ